MGNVLIAADILGPWLTACLALAAGGRVRVAGVAGALVSLAASTALIAAAPAGQLLSPALMLLFSALTVLAMLVLPRRDSIPRTIAGMLLLLGATLLGYAA